MKLTIEQATVTIHVHPGADTTTVDALTRIAAAIASLEHTTMEELDRLKQEVAEAKTVMTGATTLLTGLAQQIRDNVGNRAALKEMADNLDASANELAAAVAEGTAASGETPSDGGNGEAGGSGSPIEG
jgi:hypothetical protein